MTRARRRSIGRAAAAALGVGIVPVVVLHAVPQLQPASRLAVIAACGIPYLPVPLAVLSAGMATSSEPRGRKMFWSVVLGAALVTAWRRWAPSQGVPGPDLAEADLTVVSANVQYGRGDPRLIVDLAQSADVVAIQECTPGFEASLALLLGDDFPYREGASSDDAHGTVTWSRTPLAHARLGDTIFTSVVATTEVRGRRWRLANVHPAPPQRGSRRWESDAQRVLELVRSSLDEHLVVVGDFNAIEEHLTMRRFTNAGLRNAMSGWSAGGDGWQPTWPTDKAWVPPLIRIDHALHSRSVDAWRPRYVVVPGSDHKALVATFRAR
jgi:endonuclease/exonuclease/phosphatase family metal-dependent hydrolase